MIDLFRIGALYQDSSGTGVFFLNTDDTVSWGPDRDNLLLSEEEGKPIVDAENAKPHTGADWKLWPTKENNK